MSADNLAMMMKLGVKGAWAYKYYRTAMSYTLVKLSLLMLVISFFMWLFGFGTPLGYVY
eukprot:CAMPEP_0116877054 /NCGR_PEP_ID=MMETSP0463-20121206/8891_1 /TAXON_ID=181622 /ORGANISM="Strombidinopsis sp, Strain SopsisLIS2011" /LENGTH=58 /DNA_ID=CAMNT_0004524065 /DNA_START=1837 /DNA_END=2013 /DNA_ORIENTATION=+